MNQVTVISGKGGTGKSSIIASLAYQLKEISILADADVDAPDLYLIFDPKETEQFSYYGLKKAVIDKELCVECNECRDSCRFEAIKESLTVNDFKCEGCSMCFHVCPENAIKMVDRVSGIYMSSNTRIGKMVHARLNPGEESSGLLVAEVRKLSKKEAEKEKMKLILIDGSPGIGCPVISSLTGADLALVVTEPTLSGYHDLKRILELLKQFNIGGYVIINRFDINERISNDIEEYCKEDFPVIEKIPFNNIFTQAMIQKKTVLEMVSEDVDVIEIQRILRNISNFITSHDKIL
ncbi:MAG: 4Fe-4S binding protein [Asgard group archaeon]|nr:4Fe-4S binding protein [Asgard group archaeon]